MQGLPIQNLTKSAQGTAKSQGVAEGKATAQAEGTKNVGGDFSSLLMAITGQGSEKAAKQNSSEVQTQSGEVLKNLLAEKNADKANVKQSNGQNLVDGQGIVEGENSAAAKIKVVGELSAKQVQGNQKENKTQIATEHSIDQKIAKTTSNLDQLLNNLKGTQNQENDEIESSGDENTNALKNVRSLKNNPVKGEHKTESPLEFLVNGQKERTVSESKTPEAHIQKNVVTGEDYIKNMQTKETKTPALAVLNNKEDGALPKMMNQNAKNYGQGLSLLNDPMIRNTKDLTNKDVKKEKAINGVDELHSKETKIGAELASIRQEAIPAIQNNKENHGQTQLQTGANQKVLDLSNIHSSNTTEIIKKISDYVEQNNVAGKQSLDLTVKHESLGEFKIQVSKMPESMNRGLNQIDMQITTSSKEGHDFFVKNEVSLIKNLNQAGVNLSDLRIVASMSESTPFGQSDSRQSSSFQQNQDGSKQYMSFESSNFSSDSGAQKRKELWNEYQERYGA